MQAYGSLMKSKMAATAILDFADMVSWSCGPIQGVILCLPAKFDVM